jgi:3-methyladenine DNA glycosylase/8-oxoguanine DNA glycosylase
LPIAPSRRARKDLKQGSAERRWLGDPYRPYRIVAAWYCWRAAELYNGATDSALTG